MQLKIIGQWLIDGRSPNTGLPVLETRRIVKAGQYPVMGIALEAGRANPILAVNTPSHRTLYAVGRDQAIQLGRGKPAIGRTPPIASLRRQDVRDMMITEARDSGFVGTPEYWMAWTKMHDPAAWNYAQCDLLAREYERQQDFDTWVRLEAAKWLRYLKQRPAERYDCWVIRFADTASITLTDAGRDALNAQRS